MESPSPMLAQHLQAEDAYSRAMLKRLGVPALQQQLMHEMQAREQPPQVSILPSKFGGRGAVQSPGGYKQRSMLRANLCAFSMDCLQHELTNASTQLLVLPPEMGLKAKSNSLIPERTLYTAAHADPTPPDVTQKATDPTLQYAPLQATDPPQPPPTHAPLQTPDPPPEQIGPWLYWHADLGSTLLRRSAPGPAAEGTHAQRSTAAAAASASEACRLAADCRSSQRSTASGEASLNAGHNRQACWNSLQEPSGNLAAKGSSAQHSAAARAAAAAAAAQVPGLGSEWVHELREDAVTQQELLGGGRYPQSEESGSVEVVVDGGVLCAARDFAQQELGLQLGECKQGGCKAGSQLAGR
eukprot:1158411-Pelagomonas_calceolata.AAC.1